MATEPFLINPPRRRRRRTAYNPLGDELVVLGLGNPRRRRRRRAHARRRATTMNPRRRRRRYRMNAPDPRRRRRRRRAYFSNAPTRRRRRRRVHYANAPARRHVYRYRRNPVGRAMAFRLDRPAEWLPLAFTAGVAATTAAVVPRMLMGPGITPWMAYTVQAGVGIGGAVLIPMVGLRPVHAIVWPITVFGVLLADWLKRFALPWMGLAAYPYETAAELADMGQEPYYPPQLSAGHEEYFGAYPYQLGQQQGEEELSTGPYAKTGYTSTVPGAPWEG